MGKPSPPPTFSQNHISFCHLYGKQWTTPIIIIVIVIVATIIVFNPQVREIVYTANGEKITNEDSPLRNSDLVQLVGFTTYNSTLADDGYELLSSGKCKYCLTELVFIFSSSLLGAWGLRMTCMEFTPIADHTRRNPHKFIDGHLLDCQKSHCEIG